MKTYFLFEQPLKVFGVPFFERRHKLERLPKELTKQLPQLDYMAERYPGASVAFKTDSPTFIVRAALSGCGLCIRCRPEGKWSGLPIMLL